MVHIIFAALTTLAFALNDQTGNVGYATVRGTVSSSGHPVANVRVIAYSNVDVQETRTGADGKYLFISLLPGTYRIVALTNTSESPMICATDNRPLTISPGLEYLANFSSLSDDCS
jgi:hypothetical protein